MGRVIWKAEVEKELAARRCRKLKEYAFKTGSLWQTADGKFTFVVPQEVGGWTDEEESRRVLEMLEKRGA